MDVFVGTIRALKRNLTFIVSAGLATACAGRAPASQLATGPREEAQKEAREVWVLRGARVYVAPDRPVIDDGVIVVENSKIAAVGARDAVAIPEGARESPCSGGVVTAGFQNSHVHFMGERWNEAGAQSVAKLSANVREMLTRYGYTTVVDTASELENTVALRARIERGEIPGPRILTAGWGLFPHGGIPVYLSFLPAEQLARLRQPATAEEAAAEVRANLAGGADAIKLFAATPQGRGRMAFMPAEIARAAADEAHKQGKLVMAHPTDFDGVGAALSAGVDVLVHSTLGVEAPWPEPLLHDVIAARMAIVPTLKLLPYELQKEGVPAAASERLIDASVEHVRKFVQAGGELLFGTDVGYMTDYDPTQEYVLMARAGLTPLQILASLTTLPAQRWNESARRGRIAVGLDADLVVLDADPGVSAEHFAKVRCAFRGGAAIYSAATP